MIHDVLLHLKSTLNEHLKARSGWSPTEPWEDKVVLPDGEIGEPIAFKLGAVTELLINLEEENTLRAPDPYRRTRPDGTRVGVQPEIRMALYVLFAARFKQYEEGLRHLSMIIRYFQRHRRLEEHNAPGLAPEIDKLVVELVTLPFSEQNEIWSALRTTYHPSVLYKVSLVVFRDEEEAAAPEITELTLEAAR